MSYFWWWKGVEAAHPYDRSCFMEEKTGPERADVTQTHREQQGWLGLRLRNSPK